MQREDIIDITKGIGIILVVLGHSGFMCTNFIYLFHMALFFIVAGYCFNNKYTESVVNLGKFVRRRIVSLYVPYVLFNIVFIILNNLFIYLNIYVIDTTLIGNSPIDRVAQIYEKEDIFKEIIKVLLFSGGTQMSGTFWFFKALFCVSIIFAFARFLIKRIKDNRLKKVVEIFILIFMVIMGRLLYIKGVHTWNIGTAFSVYVMLLFGYLFRKYNDVFKRVNNKIVIVSTLIVLLVSNEIGSISLANNEYFNSIFLCVASVSGFLLVYCISDYLRKSRIMKRILCYIGKNSIVIMCFHFLAFKLINVIQIAIYNEPKEYIAAFPVLRAEDGWWIAYTIVGVIVPLGMGYVYSLFRKKFVREG